MTIQDQLSKAQVEALKAKTRKTQEPATAWERMTRPVEGAVIIQADAAALRKFHGVTNEQQGRGWHRERSQERVS
jgi:hypothetical protein